MKEFEVNIKEILERKVTVTAENREEAEYIAKKEYNQGEHILDANDLKGVNFDYIGKTLTGLLISPMKKPEVVKVNNTQKSLQNYVGGYIETYRPFKDPVRLVLNEEGLVIGLPPNRSIENDDGVLLNIIAGDFLILGDGIDDFESLSQDLIDKYSKKFEKGELFPKIGNKIIPKKVELDVISNTKVCKESGER